MNMTIDFRIDTKERQQVLGSWTFAAAKLFAANIKTVFPADLQLLHPTRSPRIEELALIAMKPLIAAGVCEQKSKVNNSWYALRSVDKAQKYLSSRP